MRQMSLVGFESFVELSHEELSRKLLLLLGVHQIKEPSYERCPDCGLILSGSSSLDAAYETGAQHSRNQTEDKTF